MEDNIPKKGPTPEMIPDQCKGCGLCVHHCPKKLIELSQSLNRLGYRYAQVTKEGCSGCATCYFTCPEPGAIQIKKPKSTNEKSA